MRTDKRIDELDLKTLQQNHEELLGLCRSLEELADSLPFDVDDNLCRKVSDAVVPLIDRTQKFEEQLLFPDLDRSAGSCFTAMMIDRLKNEHRCDRLAAEEISLTLKALLAGRCGLSFDTVGYMLRGFFECVRRHIAAETAVIDSLFASEPERQAALL